MHLYLQIEESWEVMILVIMGDMFAMFNRYVTTVAARGGSWFSAF